MTDRHFWKLGASSCVLRGSKNHTENGFRKYHDAGIKYAELSLSVWTGDYEKLDFYDHPEKIKEVALSQGVELVTFHTPFSMEVSLSIPDKEKREEAHEILEKAIRAAAKIGIKIMVLHPTCGYDEDYPDRKAYLEQTLEEVKRVNEICKSLGVILAVENMKPDHICCRSREMIYLLENIPDLKVCFDTNHSLIELPEDYLDALFKAGMKGRIVATHVSDCDLDEEMHRLPGDGKINWENVLSKLEQLEFDGVFMYEVSKAKDRVEAYTPQMISDNFREIVLSLG